MFARMLLSSYGDFIEDPGGVLPPDARNRDRRDYDETREDDPGLAFLDDAALPDPDRGCIIGVIDDAVPFAHERFRLPGGITRIAAHWAQDAVPGGAGQPGEDLGHGREWRGTGIDALRAAHPDEDALYRAAGVLDLGRASRPTAAYESGHGASVGVMAAGFDPAEDMRDRPVISVSLPPKVTEDSMGTSSPPYMLMGILFILHRARRLCRMIERRRGLPPDSVRLPVVINISYGITAGPRDGSTLFERFMDAVSVQDTPGLGAVRFVLPMGNHRQDMLCGELRPGQSVGWRLHPGDQTISAVEIWGPAVARPPARPMAITLTAPGHAPLTTGFTANGQLSQILDGSGGEIVRLYYTALRTPAGRWREGITVIAAPTAPDAASGGVTCAPAGDWAIAIDADSRRGRYEISVQSDQAIRGFPREARQSVLVDPGYAVDWPNGRLRRRDPAGPAATRILRRNTLNAYAGGAGPIRAGASEGLPYPRASTQGLVPAGPPMLQASIYSGLLADGLNGDVRAVADRSRGAPGVLAAGRTSGAVQIGNGTSLAAPQVARALAEMLATTRPAPQGRDATLAVMFPHCTLAGAARPPLVPGPLHLRPDLREY